jgi:hypothetical protein
MILQLLKSDKPSKMCSVTSPGATSMCWRQFREIVRRDGFFSHAFALGDVHGFTITHAVEVAVAADQLISDDFLRSITRTCCTGIKSLETSRFA